MKYKTGLVKEIRQKEEFKVKQKSLKEKHKIRDENVLIVEKSNTLKFILKLAINIFKSIISIGFILLAFLGLLSLIYPEIRMELLVQLMNIKEEVIGYIH